MRSLINVPPQEAITRVEDGEAITLAGEQYRVIWTPGHSDGHICLFRERDGVFIAADHVLPRITPNIGLYSEKDRRNPLGDYLASLKKVERLPASIVLPGHGEPFSDLAGRVREILAHHEEREAQILALLDPRPQHAYGIAEQLFGHRWENSEARRMAVAETLSHLEYMRYTGRVDQQRTSDGLILYEVA
jgi:glyoxylase-like metal-dependent hydrolase (beta-lactamase superfamily II)